MTTFRTVTALLAVAAGTVACAASDHPVGFDEDGGNPSTSGPGSGGAGNGSSGEGGDLNLGASSAGGGSQQESCQYVDILFLIDNSPSMSDPQEKLAGVWGSFVDAMFDKLPPNVDLHVGLTTTAFFQGNCSEQTINCVTGQTPAEVSAHFVDPGVGTTGENGGQGRLYEYDGKRFFSANTSDADHSALKSWFSAAAIEAGESGCSYEFSSAGAAFTAHPANEAYNEGFFRDEGGVLLVIFLTDEPDKSQEPASTYHDMLASVKSGCGGDDCIITAGLINPCVQEIDQTVWQVMSSFGEPPIWGDIEGEPAEYQQVVGDALAQVVKKTCDEIAVPK